MSLHQQPQEQLQEKLLLQQKEKKVKKEKKSKKEAAESTVGQQVKKKKRKEVTTDVSVDIEDMFSFNVEWCKSEAALFDFDALDAAEAEAGAGLFDFDALDAAVAASELKGSSDDADTKVSNVDVHKGESLEEAAEAKSGECPALGAQKETQIDQKKDESRLQIETSQCELKHIDCLLEESSWQSSREGIVGSAPSDSVKLSKFITETQLTTWESDRRIGDPQFSWNAQAPAFMPILFDNESHSIGSHATCSSAVPKAQHDNMKRDFQMPGASMSWNVEAPAFMPTCFEGEHHSAAGAPVAPEVMKSSIVPGSDQSDQERECCSKKGVGEMIRPEKIEKTTHTACLRIPSPSRSRSPTKNRTAIKSGEGHLSESATSADFIAHDEKEILMSAAPCSSQGIHEVTAMPPRTIAEECVEYVMEEGKQLSQPPSSKDQMRSNTVPEPSKEIGECASDTSDGFGLLSRIAGVLETLTSRTEGTVMVAESLARHPKRRWKNLEKALLADMGPPVLETCPVQAAMDRMLKNCFLQAAKTRIRDSDLPMMGTTLYGKYMRPSRLIGTSCNVKDSSFKWVKDFLEHLESEGKLVLKKGESDPKVLRICRDHPALKQWEPWPFNDTAAAQKARGR